MNKSKVTVICSADPTIYSLNTTLFQSIFFFFFFFFFSSYSSSSFSSSFFFFFLDLLVVVTYFILTIELFNSCNGSSTLFALI